MNMRDQFFANLAADGAAGQQMFSAENLGRFRQAGSGAVTHQQIRRRAQAGIGRNTGIGVRAATFHGKDQFAGGKGLPRHPIGIGQHVLDQADAPSHGLFRAAHVLNGESVQFFGRVQLFRRHHGADLVRFTAQAQQ